MRVWVNSRDGWVQHGEVRASEGRATWVARLLARRKGWETSSGSTPPAPRPARPDAPTAAEAAKSPAQFDDTREPGPTIPIAERAASLDPAGVLADEPYSEELAAFALEAQLREFMIANLPRIPIAGRRLRLYRDTSGRDGREFPTAVGPIDILAVDAEGAFYVLELKLERGPDKALGQLARYMGWVREHLADGCVVHGVIVARSIDDKLRYAASIIPGVRLLEYEIDFRLRDAGRSPQP